MRLIKRIREMIETGAAMIETGAAKVRAIFAGKTNALPGDSGGTIRREDVVEKVDPNDYLNPRVCQGEQLITNILKHLEVPEEIVNNPRFAADIRAGCKEVLNGNGIYFGEPYTRGKINSIVKAISSYEIIPDVSVETAESDMIVKKVRDAKSCKRINIDKTTGNIRLQTLSLEQGDQTVYVEEEEYSLDPNGNVVKKRGVRLIEDETGYEHTSIKTSTINKDGICLKEETHFVEKMNGITKKDDSRTSIRDPKYPLIAHYEGCSNINGNINSYYYPINPEKSYDMYPIDGTHVDIENETIRSITFESREGAVEYCEENKATILVKMKRTISQKPSIKRGIVEIASTAGIMEQNSKEMN